MPSTRTHESPKPSAHVFEPREQVSPAQKGQKKRPIAKTKHGQKEGMEGNDTNTCLQQGPMSLLNPQQMCLSQENKYFLLKKAKKSAQLQRQKVVKKRE